MNDLSATGNDRIAMGANLSPFETVALEIEDLYLEAKKWADGEPIDSVEKHDAVARLYDDLQAAGNKADALRVAEVEPLNVAKEAIQTRFHPLIGDTKSGKGKVVLGKIALNALLTKWRDKVRLEKEAIAKKAREEAEAERLKAVAAIQASAGNLEARERAEEQLALAKDAEIFANKAEKKATSGLGLRTTYKPVLRDLNAAVRHFWAKDSGPFEALVISLATSAVAAGVRDAADAPAIPGFTIEPERKAV